MSSGKTGKPLTDFGKLYLPDERLPAAKPVEEAGDSAWALFNDIAAKQEEGYAPTEAAPLHMRPGGKPNLPAPQARPTSKSRVTIEAVLLESRVGNRVCPKPEQWQAFHDVLRLSNSSAPGLIPPVDATKWAMTSALEKRACFRAQIEWADVNGCLPMAFAFIRSLPQEHWQFVSS